MMTTGPANSVLPYLCRTALGGDGAGLSDGELLERFRSRRDEAAFEALLRRHGPMVLGVCRRLLQNSADAEDAFQATFLVLLCKAGSIDPPWMVGNFLYGVAYHTARRARVAMARRRVKESEVRSMARPEAEEKVEEHLWFCSIGNCTLYRAIEVLSGLGLWARPNPRLHLVL